jgi:GTP-binding protein
LFDWEPSVASAGELIGGRRGEDIRIDQNDRRTTPQRRAEYKEMMDARAALRVQMENERKSGAFSVPPVTEEEDETEEN